MTSDLLTAWAIRHNISPLAMVELRAAMIGADVALTAEPALSEAAVQNNVRLEASRLGHRLWRNNVGAGKLDTGSFVRWGLANDSAAVNTQIKSADLIGIRSVIITPAHVGTKIGQFLSREVKHAGWKYRGTDRERAQLKWAEIINGLGGDAQIVTGVGSI